MFSNPANNLPSVHTASSCPSKAVPASGQLDAPDSKTWVPTDQFQASVPEMPSTLDLLRNALSSAWGRATGEGTIDSVPPGAKAKDAAAPETHHNSHIPAGTPPTLKRPVLFVPGYNSKRKIYEYVVDYLKQANRDGGTYDTTHPPEVDPQGQLFVLKFDKPWHSAADNAAQLKQAIDTICKATGSDKIDLVTHSMGALDARLYMDQGGEKIGRLLMVAPPNHGSRLADDDLWFRQTYHIPTYPPTRDPDVLLALEDLRCDAEPEPSQHRTGNPFLNELNAHWPEQRARLEAVDLMAGGGLPTRSLNGEVTNQGDGVVTWESSALPGLAPHVYSGQMTDNHARVLNDTRLIHDIGVFLGGGTIGQASIQA